MADLPQYQSNLTSASPQGSPIGHQATAASSSSLIGSIASSVLDESSKQLARQAGIEAADAGKPPKYPAFTQSDKEYVAAYEHQAYNSAYVSGVDFLQKTFFELSKNPSVDAFEQARVAADEYKSNVMGSVSPAVGKKLETNLGLLYNSYNAKLAEAVEEKSQQQLKQGFNSSLKASSQSMLQLATTGDYTGMQRVAEQTKESIDAMGDSIYLTPEEKKEYKKAVDLDMKASRAIGNLHRLHQVNDDAGVQDYLAKLAAAPPSAENEAIQNAAVSYQKSYDSAKNGQEQVQYLQAQQDYFSGTSMPEVIRARPGLSAASKAQLTLMDIKAKAAAQESAVQLVEANANANSPAYFSNMSTKEKAGILKAKREQMFGADKDSMVYSAYAASTFKTTFDDLNNEAQDTVTLGDAQISIETMQLIDNVNQNHPQVFAGLNSESKAMVQTYSRLKRAGNSDIAAWTAAKKIQEISPEQRAGFKKVFDDATSASAEKETYKMDTIAHSKKTVADALGISSGLVDPGLIATFRGALAEEILVDGNMAHATERVASNIGRTYGESTINGKKEFVYLPPDREIEGGVEAVQSRLYKSLRPVLDTIEQEYKSKDGNFYFETISKPVKTDGEGGFARYTLLGVFPTSQMKLKKHFRNGDSREVSIGIYADPNSSPDQATDYFVAIQDGDSLMGLTDPNTQRNMIFDLMGKSGFSEFKRPDHPNRYVDGIDTITGEAV